MQPIPPPQLPVESAPQPLAIKVIGVGNAGVKVLERVIARRLPGVGSVAVNVDGVSLAESSAGEKVHLQGGPRGAGGDGDAARIRESAETKLPELKTLCAGVQVVFIIAGMGGGAGNGLSPVVARAAREAGALVMGFVILPFACEGTCRQSAALSGRDDLMAVADCVLSFPNERKLKLIDKRTSVPETFQRCNELLADGVAGVWRLLNCSGLTQVHFRDLCSLLRDHHAESSVATAEAAGPDRSREIVEKLIAHPMLHDGRTLTEADVVLVGLTSGPELAMVEISHVMEQISRRCQAAQVLMGAACDNALQDRLALTILAVQRTPVGQPQDSPRRQPEDLGAQLLHESAAPRSGSRFLPPPPDLPPEKARQLLSRQSPGQTRTRKSPSRARQTQLQLEIISKGRFDKSEPTIHKGEDLDIPTYIRRGVALN